MNNISNMNITRATNSYGFIVPFDSEDINRSVDKGGYFVHIEQSIFKKISRIEFSVVTDQTTGKSKALHVSGPNKTVLRPISENRYLQTNLTNNKLVVDDNIRYRDQL